MRLLLLVFAMTLTLRGHEVGQEMARAADTLLGSLSAEQRTKAALPFESDERLNWKFVPAERKGLPLGEMTEAQRALASRLLTTALSAEGAGKAESIRQLEVVLADLEKGKGAVRDPLRYFVSIYGKPGEHGAWAWRFEGHHLEVQVTLLDGRIVGLTPQFMGANPGKVAQGPRAGTEVLGEEDALGRSLVLSLSPGQLRSAILPGQAPADIVSGATREARQPEPRGIPLGQLEAGQQATLWKIVGLYAGRFRGELAEPVVAELRALPPESITFAWIGGTAPGEPHYYRIQAPALLLELDNTQNHANHVHTVWRDLRNDFGGDALRAHLRAEHGAR